MLDKFCCLVKPKFDSCIRLPDKKKMKQLRVVFGNVRGVIHTFQHGRHNILPEPFDKKKSVRIEFTHFPKRPLNLAFC